MPKISEKHHLVILTFQKNCYFCKTNYKILSSEQSMSELISIIIPVHNKERYLSKCLKSILSQTYFNTEIIIVDDYSTDNSHEICIEASRYDNRIKLYRNKKNIGHLKSRYEGLKHIKGNWVIFADADDWMEIESIERLYEAATRLDVDMVQMRHQRRMNGIAVKYAEVYDPDLCDRKISGEEFYRLSSYVGMDSYIAPSCWGKIYKKELLKEAKQINFNQFWGEDQILNINYLRHARSIAFIDYIGYNYRWGGETSKYKFTMLDEYKNVHIMKRLMGQDESRINNEIINLLRYHIRQLITELGWTEDAIKSVMSEEMKDPIWQKVGLTESIEDILQQETETMQRNPIKYIAKRILR